MSQTSDGDQSNEELTIEEFAAVTVVRTAAEAAALARAELDPADDIPAGAEAWKHSRERFPWNRWGRARTARSSWFYPLDGGNLTVYRS